MCLIVHTESIQIDGLAGPVIVMTTKKGSPSITVGGQPATHVKGNAYLLPAADGTMRNAKLLTTLFDVYPRLEVAGVKHRTGPPVPAVLQLLTFLPFALALVLHAGLIGAAIGGIAMGVNLGIVRSERSTVVKAMSMLGVLAASAVMVLYAAVMVEALLA